MEWRRRYISKSVIDRKLLLLSIAKPQSSMFSLAFLRIVNSYSMIRLCNYHHSLNSPFPTENSFSFEFEFSRPCFAKIVQLTVSIAFPSHYFMFVLCFRFHENSLQTIEQISKIPEKKKSKTKNCEKCFMWNVWTMKNEFQSSIICNESEFPTYLRPSSASTRAAIKRNLNWTFVDGGSLTNVSSLKLVIHSIFNQCAGWT